MASCGVAEPVLINVHESDAVVVTNEVVFFNSGYSAVSYSGATSPEAEEDLVHRLSVFRESSADVIQVGLQEGVDMSEADYLGYSLVDLDTGSWSREVRIMILSDEEPELFFSDTSGEAIWGSPQYSRLHSAKDGRIFVFKMPRYSEEEGFFKKPLHLIVSTQDGRSKRIDL